MLLSYLFRYFITEQELLEQAKVSSQELVQFQKNEIMPQASYSIDTKIKCLSFFGDYQENNFLQFYPNQYIGWLTKIKDKTINQNNAKKFFAKEYEEKMNSLEEFGLVAFQLKEQLENHIEEEWKHFLSGIYGLCTVTGLASEIAAKEVAISIIDEITLRQTRKEISDPEKLTLSKAVELLDQVSSPFAPHERANSSRERCVNLVKELYQL